MKFYRAFNYTGCVNWYYSFVHGIASSFECILFAYTALYGLEADPVPIYITYPTKWNLAVHKIIKLKNLSDLYYVQYCMDILPINYALGLRKLSFYAGRVFTT